MKYPIGIQTFEKIIDGDFVYVDKTALIYEVTHSSQYVFLSRPRRFGKSLLLSTIEAYFEGKKELFKGLEIEKLEKDWEKHPVIHIDLNIGLYTGIEGLREQLDYTLSLNEKTYGIESDVKGLGQRFDKLIRTVAEMSGKNAVVLIDEYDKPLLEAIGNPTLQEALRDELRAFYGVLKSCDKYIRFAMLTGVTKFGRLSVFSELNNIDDISFSPRYATICGITNTELTEVFKEGISELAVEYECTHEEMVEMLRKMYDGYRFSSAKELVFNPFSILMAMRHVNIDSFWFQTGTPKYLVMLLQANHYNLADLEGVTADRQSLSSFNPDGSNPIPVIFQSGYLTIKAYDKRRNKYTLRFPNEEVRQGFMEYLLPFYLKRRDKKTFDIDNFVDDIENGDAPSFMDRLKSLSADISYEILANCEDDFQNMLYIIFTIGSLKPIIERRTSDGRIDMVVETEGFVYVMEFKVDGTAQEAIDQINSKDYALPWASDHRKVIKIGANFSTEQRRLTEYIIRD